MSRLQSEPPAVTSDRARKTSGKEIFRRRVKARAPVVRRNRGRIGGSTSPKSEIYLTSLPNRSGKERRLLERKRVWGSIRRFANRRLNGSLSANDSHTTDNFAALGRSSRQLRTIFSGGGSRRLEQLRTSTTDSYFERDRSSSSRHDSSRYLA